MWLQTFSEHACYYSEFISIESPIYKPGVEYTTSVQLESVYYRPCINVVNLERICASEFLIRFADPFQIWADFDFLWEYKAVLVLYPILINLVSVESI